MAYREPLATTLGPGIVTVGAGLAVTNGVIRVTGPVATSYYGKFFSSTNQTNPVVNTPNLVSFPNTVLNNGVTTAGTDITIVAAGIYTITYEVQAEITSGGGGDIDIWIRVDGVDLPNSNSITTIAGGGDRTIINRSFLVSLTVGQVITVLWSSSLANMRLTAVGTQTGPTRPATNSANFLATLVQAL